MSAASAYPIATANQSNYPGSVASTPYGPSFGSPAGILRAVGSFKNAGDSYDQGYLFDGATRRSTVLLPSSLTPDPVLFTIAHSNFGNQVVGNYDTQLKTGNSFIYNIATQRYSSVPLAGTQFDPARPISDVVSNTAYGVYNNVISGGYTGKFNGVDGTYAYIHNQGNGKTYTFSSPDGSIVTHFEGITSAGQPGVYNMVADAVDVFGKPVKAYVATVDLNAIDPATGQPFITWTEIAVGKQLTSANSMYQGNVIGVYTDGGITYAYYADIGDKRISIAGTDQPLYRPIHVPDGRTSTVFAGGADVINHGLLRVAGGDGIQSGSSCGYLGCAGSTAYGGVVSNYGTVSVSGSNTLSAVRMQGTFGTLVNYGTLRARDGGYAIRTDASARGSLIVNGTGGVIDGRVSALSGRFARFENSGLMTISEAGAGATHQISGTFVQTSDGELGLRINASGADALEVAGTARVAGALTLVAADDDYGSARRTLVSASEGLAGRFESINTNLQNAHRFGYDANSMYVDVFEFRTADVQLSVNRTLASVQQTLAVQNAALVNSFMYDCGLFNEHGVCASIGMRYTAINASGMDESAGTFVLAYRLTPEFRFGAYIDQTVSNANSNNIASLSTTMPLIGLFGAWQERPDGIGAGIKLSAAYGEQQASVVRSPINGTELATGTTNLTGQGFQLLTTYGLGVAQRTVLSPYLGVRYTESSSSAYTESQSAGVRAALSYGGLSSDLTTLLAGLSLRHQFNDSWSLMLSAGVESDLNQSTDSVTVTGLQGLNASALNNDPVQTRATFAAGLWFDITKNQRVSLDYVYRQSPYQGIDSNAVFLNYTIGL
ncbi:autotransporter outer membrane beta-barrel domain-containing protein [Orrella marina]|uniref:Autotransporter domain-containing protein n=1 Tax=Orrella marina TaxID=2163011 RepID=A0A2R4XH84_9BURK|nr:autotransporter outer membrane beta-barrel domain-containing protein [Orrella marina]AWB33172.1 hypothetical protein DBV39_04990 [Orrella marina]